MTESKGRGGVRRNERRSTKARRKREAVGVMLSRFGRVTRRIDFGTGCWLSKIRISSG